MKEEDIIRTHDSGRSPFKTPDGYFDNFTGQLMERMAREGLLQTAEQPPVVKAKVVAMSPLRRALRYAAAAVVVGFCVATGTYFIQQQNGAEEAALTADASDLLYSDEALDYELDYELVNNQQIAYYLTEAY
ncbi:MAG: hypothetical protein IJQ59_03550 [Bacteroidaceae bacterium]|nr:hypothetical protein [Bacteroidaceae bacterium]